MSSVGSKRKLTTIMAADVVGYSRLVAADDEAAIRRFQQLREVFAALVVRHDGRIFGGAGDSLMSEFPSAVEAVRCGLEIQEEIAVRNAGIPADRAMLFRIGINIGDSIVEGDNLFGDGVNVAARLQEIADPGGMVLSAAAYDQIKNKVAVEIEPLGPRSLKNIPEPVTTFRVRMISKTAAPGEAAPSASSDPSPAGGWKRRALAAGLVMLAMIGAFVGWDGVFVPGTRIESFRAQAAQPLPIEPSIVVMPFVNASEDESQEYFCLGIAEDVLTSLTKVSGLFVVGRDSAMSLKNKNVQPTQIGRELGVRYVLQGSVRRSDNRVRISTRLVDAATEQTVWAARYDRELGDIFAVQDDIAGNIVQSLSVSFQPGERDNMRQQLAMSPKVDAYDLFLQGRRKMVPPSPKNLDEAQGLFEKAVAADSSFASGLAGLSRVQSMRLNQGFITTGRDEVLRRAEETARTALQKDNRSTAAMMSLASALLLKGQQDEAVRYARQAYLEQPGDAYIASSLGLMLTFSGRPQEAYYPIERSLERERVPEYQSRTLVFKLYAAYHAGDYAAAEQAVDAHVKGGGECFLNCLAYAAATKLRLADQAQVAQNSLAAEGFTAQATQAAKTLNEKYPEYRARLDLWLKLYKNEADAGRFKYDVDRLYATLR